MLSTSSRTFLLSCSRRSTSASTIKKNHHIFMRLTTTTVAATTTSPVSISTTTTASSVPNTFAAWRVEQKADGSYVGSEQRMPMYDMNSSSHGSEEDHQTDQNKNKPLCLIRVTHSSLNYKDALSAAGNKGVTRHYPHTPGIDAAGYLLVDVNVRNTHKNNNNAVAECPVIVTGYDLGMNTDGGFGEYIHVPTEWVVPLPTAWGASTAGLRTSMVYGTAGLTAALLVDKLFTDGGEVVATKATPSPASPPVVAVTGATGAVGSVAVELLSRLGFHVVAITGKATTQTDMLRALGAAEILGREALQSTSKPLLKPRFDHAIDTVGGAPLAELLKQIKPGGSVACCGLVAGSSLNTTVLPFILRGIQLLGVDSVEIPLSRKIAMWEKLSTEWACPQTEHFSAGRDIGRHQLGDCLAAMLRGESVGKIVLDHSLTQPK